MFASKATPEKHAHVIVCGNEKCGSGKTITAMHIIVSLLNEDFRVASIDLDIRQMRLTRYIQNREYWAAKNDRSWPMPQHFLLEKGGSDSVLENENAELSSFSGILQRVERLSDFIVIDTPGHDSYLTRRAHSIADPLITPLNDSCLDSTFSAVSI
jgi:chromosome partitioning protein